MNLHQFRFVREAVRQNFNLTEASKALFTSQPGVSKSIIELEEELGVDIFRRHGKRIRNLTEPGEHILASIEKILQEITTLKKVAQEYAAQDQGNLVIATTHTQARYVLPKVIAEFTQRFPKVHLSIQQGSPSQVAYMVEQEEADLAITTGTLSDHKGLIALPAYRWGNRIITLPNHPLLSLKNITLTELAKYPLIAYSHAFSGRIKIDEAFAKQNLQPDIVLEANDADVIKTYVAIGLGLGIIAEMSFNAENDPGLCAISAGDLFGTNLTYIALKQDTYLCSYIYTFIELFAPALHRKRVEQAMKKEVDDILNIPELLVI
ncbi:MAG: CysB family HTH-type transcriptional regulator [Ottowia sp.]|nr:CysB family HTH-type transcriptional regulator [Ottowia sp.]